MKINKAKGSSGRNSPGIQPQETLYEPVELTDQVEEDLCAILDFDGEVTDSPKF